MCQRVDLVPYFSSQLLLLLIIRAFIHGKKLNLKSNLIDSYSFFFKAELLDKNSGSLVVEALSLFTLKVSLTILGMVISQQTIVSLSSCI